MSESIAPGTIGIDAYVFSVLMRDLVLHDHSPSGYLVFLHLWSEAKLRGSAWVRTSHQAMAESTGLSKSAVQKAVKNLADRQLVRVRKGSVTATPEYRVLRPWRR